MMDTAKVFKTGRSQAVRLPKEYRFRGKEVCVTRVDDMVILFPRSKGWDILERGLKQFTPDFMAQRDQPAQPEHREDL